MTGADRRGTRAERMAMPLARNVVKDLAAEHGACQRPVQLRRTEIDTGYVEQVLIPCGHTLASVCPPCAERARILRATQCREGWHLDHEPVIDPDPATGEQRALVTDRAEVQADRDALANEGLDTADLDERIGELDEQITDAGMRGNVLPNQPRRHRSTRRRQDAAPLPRRPVSNRTVGKTYTAPDGKTFRPSLFVTLTCPSYGRVCEDGAPADPDTYDYTRAARDALHFAALFDRFIQNLRRLSAMTCSTSPPSNPSGGSPRTSTSRSAAPSPAPSSARSSPPPTTRSGGPPPQPSSTTAGTCRSGTSTPATYLDPDTGEVLPTWDQALDAIGDEDEPLHVARFGARFDAQGVLAGSKDASRCIGYLTKYLTKHVGDCHQAATDAQAAHAARLADALRYEPCSPTCANWLRYGIQPKNARPGLRPGCLQGQGPPPRVPRLRRAPGPGLPQVVRQDAGRPPRRPPDLADRDARTSGNRPAPLHLGTGQTRRPGPHAQRPAAAARRRRPHPMANRTRGGHAQSRNPSEW